MSTTTQGNQYINEHLTEIARLTNALVTGEKIENVFFGVWPDEPEFLTMDGIAESINGKLKIIAHIVAGN